jgi:uncharacterized membrane protein YdfJ with MMPL/SSD domain
VGGFWLRWAEGLGRRPLIPAVLALAVIVILAIPVLSFRTALLDASLIMILVFAAFILTGQVADMQIGLGFAAAIFVDAYIIRTVFVPP